MGWTKSPPYFYAFSETITDLANAALNQSPEHASLRLPHKIDDMANSVTVKPATLVETQPQNSTLLSLPLPVERDPALIRTRPKPTTAVDIFVDDYLVVAQGSPSRRSKARRSLFHALDKVFRPLSDTDSAFRKEPLSLKNLQKGECSWTTSKTILGWDIDTEATTLSLTPRRA